MFHVLDSYGKCVYCGKLRADINNDSNDDCEEHERVVKEQDALLSRDKPKADLIGEALRKRDPWDVPKKN